ncbi:hypothetical protein [Flavimaricola marinus]|uniref:DUF883 domain-containing protein n=1 Tax=Flavimaricola marinus TaxID=1819565 RepID=A0A238LJH1_9RHOB|nr:hypothetical protein [Flavimaricola marinus]SMY09116.1 hypothetical protein LOM8899_03278 [Flavimaricola marinus]
MPQSRNAEETMASDLEAVRKQLAALKEDMASLAETMAGIAGRRSSNLTADIADGLEEAKRYAASSGKSVERQIEASVVEHPMMTLGLAALAGFLVGTMSRR